MVYGTAQRRRQKKLDAILDAAMDLVGEGGLDALTVGALSERMDWTRGAMYRYFRGKGQLIAALNGRVIEGWSEAGRRAADAQEDASACTRVLAVIDVWVDRAHERPAEFGLISLTLADPRDLVERIDEATHIPAMMGLLGVVVRLLAEAEGRGELVAGDPLARTLQLVFASFGVLQLKKLARFQPHTFDTPTLARRTARDLLAAWAMEQA